MIIKAGTYRFNEVINALPYSELRYPLNATDSANFLRDYGFDIVPAPVEMGGTTYTITRLSIANIFGDQFENGVAISFSEGIITNLGSISPYMFYGAVFTIPVDTEANEITFNWFTSNTTMLIEAGTYRWNDILTLPTTTNRTVYIPIDFSVTHHLTPDVVSYLNSLLVSQGMAELSHDSYTFTFEFDEIIYYHGVNPDGSEFLSMGFEKTNISVYPDDSYALLLADDFFSSYECYHWHSNSTDPSYWGPDTWAQIITITEDTYGPTTFGLWANENWKPYSEEEETYTIGAGIYKFKSTLTRPSTDFSQEMSFAVVGSEQLDENARYRLMKTGRDMYLDFISVGSDKGIAFYAFEKTSNGNIGFLWDTQTIQVLEPIKASAVFNDWFKASTEKIVNPDTLNAKVQSLVDRANNTTGKSDTDLTNAVLSLAEGYGQGGSGECNHETYDGQIAGSYVRLKSKIEKPTENQKSEFVNGDIAFVPRGIEQAYGIVPYVTYLSIPVSENVMAHALRLKCGVLLPDDSAIELYYIWEEDAPIMKLVLESQGINGTAVVGEGWYTLNDNNVAMTPEELLRNFSFDEEYGLWFPYGNYLDSLFYFQTDDRKQAEIITTNIHRHYNTALLTQDTLCNRDIILRGSEIVTSHIYNQDGTPHIEHGKTEEHDRLGYVDITVVADDPSRFNIMYEVMRATTAVTSSVPLGLVSEKNSIKFLRQGIAYGITIQSFLNNIRAVYTNATIVSQSENEVYISGLRHCTHIVVVAE